MPQTKKHNRSPQIAEAKDKAYKHGYNDGVDAGVAASMEIFLWAFVSKFNPSVEAVAELSAELDNVIESVNKGNLDIAKDIRPTLKDEYNLSCVWVQDVKGSHWKEGELS